MNRLVCTCELQGRNFSPELVAQVTGLNFTQQTEPGETGSLGRYRGQPTPYGSATIGVPGHISADAKILWLARRLTPYMQILKDSGAENIHLNISLFHDGPCHWSLTAEEFKAVSILDIDMHISTHANASFESN